MRRMLGGLLLVLAAICTLTSAFAESYPTRPIKIIVPFGAGGITDVYAREVAQRLETRLGQPVVVEDRPGQGGSYGAASVARAAADGYTLLVGSNANTFGQVLYPDLPFNILTDFVPIARGGTIVNVFVVNPSFPANSIQDVITRAKAQPGKVSYGSSGYGGGYFMTMEMFKYMSGTNIFHVPYKTEAAARLDVIAGRVDMMITAYAAAASNIKSGQLRVLAVTSTSRFSVLPDVPTIAESGVPGYDGDTWIGLLTPEGTPNEAVTRLSAELARIAKEPDFRAKLASLGMSVVEDTPEQFAAYMKKDVERWRKVIEAAGIVVKQ
jgi:tripartite-type tricarboxylate transporter receptor subunit TctC